MIIISLSVSQTKRIAKQIGHMLEPGAVLALTGGLGSGKTAFAQGIAIGLDVPDNYYITSPTYTLINEYPGRLLLYHIDLYRIDKTIDFEDIGLEECLFGEGVVVVEWADKLDSASISESLQIHFEILDDTTRKLHLTAYGKEYFDILKRLKDEEMK